VAVSRVARGAGYLALAAAGFRRYAAYRQAMVAAIFTNTIFGFLRCSVLLALAGAGTVAGYDEPRLATFVWAGQGLIGVVLLWGPNELADRIRTGDVIADLLRPVDLVWQLLFVATATLTFWWVESGELGNALTYGGHDFSGYPITVYGAVFRRLFAYGLGFAFVAYYPALALLGRHDPLGAPAALGYGCPLIAAVAAWLAGLLWRAGVRHYRSTGS